MRTHLARTQLVLAHLRQGYLPLMNIYPQCLPPGYFVDLELNRALDFLSSNPAWCTNNPASGFLGPCTQGGMTR
jgi:hypothetical protein